MAHFKNLIISTFILLASCDSPKSQDIPWNEETQSWLKNEVYPASNLNFEDSDFDQFNDLKSAIGDKSIIMLGEQTHGDGTTFRAKALLVKFLHEEMGFNVLVFESGFYQSHKTWSELEMGSPHKSVIQKGIHNRWSRVQQLKQLFTYIGEQTITMSSLKTVGMDVKFDESYSKRTLLNDFRQFSIAHKIDLVSDGSYQFFQKYVKQSIENPRKVPDDNTCKKLNTIINAYILQIGQLNAKDNEFDTPAFWTQVLHNLQLNINNNWRRSLGTISRTQYFSERDSMMAQNINWILNKHEKVIIWASVTHNMRNASTKLLDQMNWSTSTKFMGHYLKNLVGESEMFHITFTGYQGRYTDINRGNTIKNFKTPTKGSIEDILNRGNADHAYFLLNTPNTPSWINSPFKASFIFNKEYAAQWNTSIDAVFYSNKMEPSKVVISQ